MAGAAASEEQRTIKTTTGIYQSSGRREGEPGQGPAAWFSFHTVEGRTLAAETGIYLSSVSTTESDPLIEEVRAWEDASADAFWLFEELLDEDD